MEMATEVGEAGREKTSRSECGGKVNEEGGSVALGVEGGPDVIAEAREHCGRDSSCGVGGEGGPVGLLCEVWP